ncbi:MAG: sigma-70 family RNA polymerase sigma factor [Phycisphaerales bacterium]|nr:MAG: sigma-70 family RNA polymerase sigma factor [Phycisphaerales bacterium]
MNDLTDAELVQRFRRGDKGAFSPLARRWEGKAYSLAYRLTLDAAESDDIKQTALMRAFKGLAEFNGKASFSTWFHRIVVNLCRDRMRSRRVRDRVLGEQTGDIRGEGRFAQSACRAGERAETSSRVAQAVASLPTAVREVVVMRHYQDLPFARIAEILDAPVSTVKSRMAQGLRLLQEQLKDVAE